MRIRSAVLATGSGESIQSSKPIYLHKILGHSVLSYTSRLLRSVVEHPPTIFADHELGNKKLEKDTLPNDTANRYQNNSMRNLMEWYTGALNDSDHFLMINADSPLLTAGTLKKLLKTHLEGARDISVVSFSSPHSTDYPRLLQLHMGEFIDKNSPHASSTENDVREYLSGAICISNRCFGKILDNFLDHREVIGEVANFVEIAINIGFIPGLVHSRQPDEDKVIKSRLDLADGFAILRDRINRSMSLDGVTIINPLTTFIEPGVKIGKDTIIWPETYLRGKTTIGGQCIIGPNATIENTKIGDRCIVKNAVLESASLEDDVDVGPFGHLRKGAYLARGVHMGNFGEVKNSYLGPGTKMGHFSYVGDTTTGERVNIGAGVVTCNYDGKNKHKIDIGSDVFLGSDTMLIAPLKLGSGARTGAGSVVTRDIKENTLAVGAPARSIQKLDE